MATLPKPVKRAIENPVVRSNFLALAVAVNTSLIRRSGEAYKPRAIQQVSAEIN